MKKLTVACAVLAAALLAQGSVAWAADSPVARAQDEVRQARGLLDELKGEVAGLKAEGFSVSPEERFIDANIYLDLKRYDQAALMMTSIIEDPRFKADKRYYDGVRLLGIAHFNGGNLYGARKQFEILLTAGVQTDVALSYLVEIAARLGRTTDLERLAARIDDRSASDGLKYSKGKALFFLGRHGDAVSVLSSVAASAPDGPRARYLAAACLVALKRLPDAKAVLELLASTKTGDDPELKKIVDLANLGMGRVLYDLGEYSSSIDYYQRVSKDSDVFDVSLYEVTHVYLRWAAAKDDPTERFREYVKADELLGILLNVAKDPNVVREARVLQGRICMFMERYDDAKAAYQEIIDRFAATSGELTDIAQDPESIDRFFKAMIAGGTLDQKNMLVSADVLEWMRTQPDLGRVVDLLTDVARQRATLEEARLILSQLEFSLSQPTARELLPGFSDVWLKTLEAENRLLEADGLLLDHEAQLVGRYLSPEEGAKLSGLVKQRQELERQLASAPVTVMAYKARSRELALRLRELSRDVDEQLLRITQVRDQVTAMQALLREVKYKGSKTIEVKDEQAIGAEIQKEAGRLDAMVKEAEALRDQVARELLLSEVGDVSGESERDVKAKLWSQHRKEADFYIERKPNMGPPVQEGIDRAGALRREILGLLDVVRQHQEAVDAKATKLITYYKKLLSEEKVSLLGRDAELKETEIAAMRFARDVGSGMLLAAKEGMVEAVIEADLGIVDLTWQQVRNESEKIERIQMDRAEVISKLRAELEDIVGETGTKEQ